MTHDELLAKIKTGNEFIGVKYAPDSHTFALRAVVELHKPKSVTNIWTNEVFTYCSICCTFGDLEETSREIPYPCPTIQAIEKAVK